MNDNITLQLCKTKKNDTMSFKEEMTMNNITGDFYIEDFLSLLPSFSFFYAIL